MSLEEALNRNSEALEKNTEVHERMIAIASGKLAAAGATTEAATKATRATKAKADAGADNTATGNAAAASATTAASIPDQIAVLKPKIAAWLNEFGDPDPEHEARGTKLTDALKKLGVEKVGQITEQNQIDRLTTWINKQTAAGRITPAPAPEPVAAAEADGDDI